MSLCAVGPAARGGMRGSIVDWQLNRPAGLSIGFDSPLSGMSSGTPNESGLVILYDAFQDSDPTAPYSPPSVVRYQYPGNDAGNGGTGGWIYSSTARAFKKLYMCCAVRFPQPYNTHNVGEKFWYPITTNGIATAQGITGAPYSEDISLSLNTQSGYASSANTIYYQSAGPTIKKGDRWNMVESYFEMNSPNTPNGIWRAWINGALALEFTDVVFSVNDDTWNQMRWTGTRGGGAGTLTPPEGQTRLYDRVSVWGSNS